MPVLAGEEETLSEWLSVVLNLAETILKPGENLTACTLGEGQARQKRSAAMKEVFSPR